MTKRALAALIWFGAMWFGYEILWSVADLPRVIGPVLAASVATLVTLDPIGRFWTSQSVRRATLRRLPAGANFVA
jgi:hypothetical protein